MVYVGARYMEHGILFSSFISSVAKQPNLKNDLFSLTIISFALIEAIWII